MISNELLFFLKKIKKLKELIILSAANFKHP